MLDEQQQPEIIEVHGCNPGFFSLGDGENMVCIADHEVVAVIPWVTVSREAPEAPVVQGERLTLPARFPNARTVPDSNMLSAKIVVILITIA